MLRFVLLCFCLQSFSLSAQETDTIPLLRSFGIAYENDLLTVPVYGRTDYYYTGGSFIEFNLPALRKNPVSKILLKLEQGRDESFGISINNLGFTPTSIKSDTLLSADRPFCGTLFLGLNRVSCNKNKQLRLSCELDLGVIGPLAFGYETQKFIHSHTNNPIPHGWQFQIANDLYLNYSLRLEKGLLIKNIFEMIAYGNVNAGTIYDNAALGLKIRTGRMDPYFNAASYSKRLQFYLYAGAEAKVTGRDATLQGGLFNHASTYVIANENINRAILLETAGVVFAFKRIRIDYYNVFITPEFKGGRKHAWGHLGLTFAF
ncbi:MAG: lipid A deacylase LpxR family protein [Bacteroidia bacterium]